MQLTKPIPEGVRKYRAFLFSLLCLTLLELAGRLTPTYVEGLSWLLGLFVAGNAVVHGTRAIATSKAGPGPEGDPTS